MGAQTPVLIVGGGPTGLAASLTLSHLGVPSMLVNKYPGTLEHPKAVGIMQRTGELLRLWGAEDEIRRRGCPARVLRAGWSGPPASPARSWAAPRRSSPTTRRPSRRARHRAGLRCPQNITEAVLRERAESHEIADLHYGYEMTGFEQDDDGVTATIVARDGGETTTVRAQYMIAADGNDSAVRDACGIGRDGEADMGHFVNIYHRAPLGPLVRDRPGWSYQVLKPDRLRVLRDHQRRRPVADAPHPRPGRDRRGLRRGSARWRRSAARPGSTTSTWRSSASSPGSWAPSSRRPSATGASC